MTVAVFLLALGATARITRFINADALAGPLRAAATRIAGDEDRGVAYLVRCPWCASMWVAGGVYAAAYFYGHTAGFLIATAALSASFLIGLAADVLDPPDDDE